MTTWLMSKKAGVSIPRTYINARWVEQLTCNSGLQRVSGWAWPDILVSSGFIWESLPHWIPWKRDPGRFQTWPWGLMHVYAYGPHIHINKHIHVILHKHMKNYESSCELLGGAAIWPRCLEGHLGAWHGRLGEAVWSGSWRMRSLPQADSSHRREMALVEAAETILVHRDISV